MSAQASASIDPQAATVSRERVQLFQIDRSLRGPALLFLASGILWLLVGSLLAMIASIKLHNPNFLGAHEWLTFGRVRSAHLNAVAYGWGNNAIFAVGLWIMARLCRAPVRHGGILYFAGLFYNAGLTWGVLGILDGGLTSVEWLEMPPQVAPVLALSYALVGAWAVVTFQHRQAGHVYVSQWYILGAVFWFPWLYTVAQMMILWEPARGTVQAITNWWFAHNVLGLWLTPMALAAAYYFIPKVLGRPIYSYYLSLLGFWTLALFYNWAGVHHLIGGPIPIWLQAAGTVASVMMVVPVVITAINHHMTVVGSFKAVWASPTLRFIVFGAMNYTVVSLAGSAMALPEVNVITHFTQFTVAHAHHGAYAFFTMIMFGSIYFMMPRLLLREWPSAALIRIHFYGTAVGIMIYMIGLHAGGWQQGLELNNPEVPFLTIVQNLVPWLVSRSVGGAMMGIGHLAFAINFFWMLLSKKSVEGRTGPTLFSTNLSGGAA